MLHIITGDIIKESKGMDAIVNPQNKYMIKGSGVCGAIYNAAGENLTKYCKEKYDTFMYTGEVRITPGFDLNMDIIHVLAPVFKEEDKPIHKLMEVYENLLNTIIDKKYKRVIMPSIGCGIFGYKHERVAKGVIKLLLDYTTKYDIDIYFVNLYPVYTSIYLEEYLLINNISLSKNLNKDNIITYLKDKGLYNNDIKDKYINFIEGNDYDNETIEEKLIYIQYCIEYNVDGVDIGDCIKKLITFKEWLKLSSEEKRKYYKYLTPHDRFLVRQGDYYERKQDEEIDTSTEFMQEVKILYQEIQEEKENM